jgi:hypothetical protein
MGFPGFGLLPLVSNSVPRYDCGFQALGNGLYLTCRSGRMIFARKRCFNLANSCV